MVENNRYARLTMRREPHENQLRYFKTTKPLDFYLFIFG